MFKKIVAVFLIVLIGAGLLWFGGTSYGKFANDIELKNPVEVYDPLIKKIGLDLSVDVEKDNGGSLLVSADDETKPSKPTEKHEHSEETEKPTEPVQKISVSKDQLKDLIANIKVADDANLNKDYDRTTFETPRKTYELNGKKYSRHDYAYLTSDYLISEEPFQYKCPYTGLIIEDPSKLDFDHIIPLKYVYERVDWDQEKCNEYSYSQSIGVDVQNKANRSKGARGPSDWLPDVNIGDYCYTWLVIAEEWDIPLSQEDINICQLECLNEISSGHSLKRID